VASVVKQTLYPVSGRASMFNIVTGAAHGSEVTQTAAQAHDASASTYDRAGLVGYDGDPGYGSLGVRWTLDTCTYAGTIDKVRVRVRSKFSTDGDDPVTHDLQWHYDSEANGSAQAVTNFAAWYEFDAATKPAGGAWTASDINAHQWGWLATVETASDSSYDATDIYGYEFEVLVYGPDTGPDQTTHVGAGSGSTSDVVESATAEAETSASMIGTAQVISSSSAGSIVSISSTATADVVPSSTGDCVVSAGGGSGVGAGAVSVHFSPPLSVDSFASEVIPPPIDGYTGISLPTHSGFSKILSKQGQIHLRSLGKPHFAFAMLTDVPMFYGGLQYGIVVSFAMDALPAKIVSSDEAHWIFSLHEAAIGGRELLAVGVTPAGAFACATRENGTVLSANGSVPADGNFHEIQLVLMSNPGTREVYLDGRGILSVVGPTTRDFPWPGGANTPSGNVRLTLFNGKDGNSVLTCEIARIFFYAKRWRLPSPQIGFTSYEIGWPVDEGRGGLLTGLANQNPGVPEANLLQATWFDGQPRGSCPEDPSLPLTSAYTWGRSSSWTPRVPLSPVYRKVVTP
jgi:hypothetical protein